MEKSYKAVILIIVAAFLSAFALILFKFASQTFEFSVVGILTNVPLIVGFLLYGLVAVMFILALRDGELSVLYPLMASAYVWTAIASPFFFADDSLNALKVVGIAAIIFGVYSIGRGIEHKVEVI
jgi:multidrug transporter EmrE-like cation transporter